jgi:hypothetical protein
MSGSTRSLYAEAKLRVSLGMESSYYYLQGMVKRGCSRQCPNCSGRIFPRGLARGVSLRIL